MTDAAARCGNVLVVDDDVIMREVLAAILTIEGYTVQLAESGESALALLAGEGEMDVILVDLHMPGLQGSALAAQLNAVRGPETLLIGMSGKQMDPSLGGLLQAFLEKPFAFEDFEAAVESARGGTAGLSKAEAASSEGGALDEDIYGKLATVLPSSQLHELYRLTVEDVRRRVERMRGALQRSDMTEVRVEAHAIKGGCGMVGARELSALAAEVEGGSVMGNPPFADFDAACVRLQVMLDARKSIV